MSKSQAGAPGALVVSDILITEKSRLERSDQKNFIIDG
jgi:hypothetical protein